MGTRLNRIVLKGYRSIREADISFAPINVLIGANGAGKSNFLHFFRFMQQLARGELQRHVQDQGGPERILHFGLKRTKDLQLKVEFDIGEYQATLVATSTGALVLTSELSTIRGEDGRRTLVDFIGSGTESTLARDSAHPVVAMIRTCIESWRVYHFHDTTPQAASKQPAGVSNNVWLMSDAANIAAFLRRIKNTAEYELIRQTIRRVAPFFDDFVLVPNDSAGRFVELRWSHTGTDIVFDAHDLSDGTLRFICLATLLLQPEPPDVIILDEPELGLHPFALKILAGLMRSVSARSQIVVSTQSVTFANQFDPADIIVVDREDEASRLRRLQPHELDAWLNDFDYGVGDLWEKNIIGGTPQ